MLHEIGEEATLSPTNRDYIADINLEIVDVSSLAGTLAMSHFHGIFCMTGRHICK